MYDDVKLFKNRCGPCIRNDNHPIVHHPAFSNIATNINDEISIDFSWGYPVSVEGFTGTMLIQEELV